MTWVDWAFITVLGLIVAGGLVGEHRKEPLTPRRMVWFLGRLALIVGYVWVVGLVFDRSEAWGFAVLVLVLVLVLSWRAYRTRDERARARALWQQPQPHQWPYDD